jgi:hypothetical protein
MMYSKYVFMIVLKQEGIQSYIYDGFIRIAARLFGVSAVAGGISTNNTTQINITKN